MLHCIRHFTIFVISWQSGRSRSSLWPSSCLFWSVKRHIFKKVLPLLQRQQQRLQLPRLFPLQKQLLLLPLPLFQTKLQLQLKILLQLLLPKKRRLMMKTNGWQLLLFYHPSVDRASWPKSMWPNLMTNKSKWINSFEIIPKLQRRQNLLRHRATVRITSTHMKAKLTRRVRLGLSASVDAKNMRNQKQIRNQQTQPQLMHRSQNPNIRSQEWTMSSTRSQPKKNRKKWRKPGKSRVKNGTNGRKNSRNQWIIWELRSMTGFDLYSIDKIPFI